MKFEIIQCTSLSNIVPKDIIYAIAFLHAVDNNVVCIKANLGKNS